MAAQELFRFEFVSPLGRSQVEEIGAVTGMRIGDVDNPYKDTPGQGRFAGNVLIFLSRDDAQARAGHTGYRDARTWQIQAFSPDLARTDLGAVRTREHHIRQLMDRIAVGQWREVRATWDTVPAMQTASPAAVTETTEYERATASTGEAGYQTGATATADDVRAHATDGSTLAGQ